MASDSKLGYQIRDKLVTLGIETPFRTLGDDEQRRKFDRIAHSHELIMDAMGMNLKDDSLQDTPKRVAKMYCHEIFTGLDYEHFPKCTVVENKMQYSEMVLEKGIEVNSMCEHHFLPFVGTAAIAYLPNKMVLGLSKLNRVTDFFSRRPQVQERLTEQVYHALSEILHTPDIAVLIEATHFCVKLRGVKHTNCSTTTSKLGGKFMELPALRAEFMALVGKK